MAMIDIGDFFKIGMKRDIGYAISPNDLRGLQLDLGPGHFKNPYATDELGLPDWDADLSLIPFDDETFIAVWATHFLEHVMRPVDVLMEIERVLEPGGWFYCVVPYYTSQMAYQDLTHKHFFTEETFKTLMDNSFYNILGDKDWQLIIRQQFIMGVVERNLALFTAFQKGDEDHGS